MNNQYENDKFNKACNQHNMNRAQKNGFSEWYHNNYERYVRQAHDFNQLYEIAGTWMRQHGSGWKYQQ